MLGVGWFGKNPRSRSFQSIMAGSARGSNGAPRTAQSAGSLRRHGRWVSLEPRESGPLKFFLVDNLSPEENAVEHERWCNDLSVKLLCIFVLDRFGDFVSDQVGFTHRRSLYNTDDHVRSSRQFVRRSRKPLHPCFCICLAARCTTSTASSSR